MGRLSTTECTYLPTYLPQGGARPLGEVGGGVGGELQARGPGAAAAEAWVGGRVLVVCGAGNAGPGVLFVREGGRRHGAAAACVAASREVGVA